MGSDAVEIDLQLTADHQLVVIHDEAISELYTPPLVVTASLSSEIKNVRFGEKTDPSFPLQQPWPSRIPFLDDLLIEVGPAASFINIELKVSRHIERLRYDEYITELLRVLDQRNITPWRIKSFDLELVNRLAQWRPRWPIHVLIEDKTEWERKFSWCNASVETRGICVDYTILTDEMIQVCAGEEVYLSVFTVNDLSIADQLIKRGVKDVITDDPGALLEHLKQ